jgi:hypothetical protein
VCARLEFEAAQRDSTRRVYKVYAHYYTATAAAALSSLLPKTACTNIALTICIVAIATTTVTAITAATVRLQQEVAALAEDAAQARSQREADATAAASARAALHSTQLQLGQTKQEHAAALAGMSDSLTCRIK